MRSLLFALLVVLLWACDRPNEAEQTRAAVARALSGILVYPQSTVVTFASGDEAAQLVLNAPGTMADIARWYRHALETNGWIVQSEVVRDGKVVMYAQQKAPQRPLWITIQPNVGGPGSTYTLVGTLPHDSAQGSTPARN